MNATPSPPKVALPRPLGSASTLAAVARRLRALQRLPWLAGGCLAAFLLLLGTVAWRDARQERLGELQVVGALSATALGHYFSELDLALANASRELRDSGADTGDPRVVAQDVMRRLHRFYPEAVSVALVRLDDSVVLAHSLRETDPTQPALPVPAREILARIDFDRWHRGLAIGRPLVGPVSQRWLLPVAYVVRHPGGRDVALALTLPIDFLEHFWGAKLPPGYTLGLIRPDAIIVNHWPLPEGYSIQRMFEQPRTGALALELTRRGTAATAGIVEGESSVTGVQSAVAYRYLPNARLYVYAAVPSRVVFDNWLARVWLPALLATMLAATGFAAARLLLRRRAADADLRHRAQLADARDAAKSALVARVSHELRTPLHGILGLLELLAREPPDPPAYAGQRRRVAQARQTGEHLLAMIDDLLDLSQAEAGQLTTARRPVALDALLDDLDAVMRPLAEAESLTLTLRRSPRRLPTVSTDGVRLKQVLLNLLGNAVKYNRPDGRVELSAAVADGALIVIVRDSGLGMSAQQLAHLFEPFNRLGRDDDGRPGSGIGLAITQRLVVAMGGTIAVDSSVGAGTTVTVRLHGIEVVAPVDGAAAGAADGAAGGAVASGRGGAVEGAVDGTVDAATAPAAAADIDADVDGRAAAQAAPDAGRRSTGLPALPGGRALDVVYADDDEVNREIVAALALLVADLTIECLPSGAEALARVHQRRPDVLLVDMQMPGMTGHDVLRAVRASPALASLPVVVLSAQAMQSDIETALAAGFDGYLTKPAGPAAVLQAIIGAARPRGDRRT